MKIQFRVASAILMVFTIVAVVVLGRSVRSVPQATVGVEILFSQPKQDILYPGVHVMLPLASLVTISTAPRALELNSKVIGKVADSDNPPSGV